MRPGLFETEGVPLIAPKERVDPLAKATVTPGT